MGHFTLFQTMSRKISNALSLPIPCQAKIQSILVPDTTESPSLDLARGPVSKLKTILDLTVAREMAGAWKYHYREAFPSLIIFSKRTRMAHLRIYITGVGVVSVLEEGKILFTKWLKLKPKNGKLDCTQSFITKYSIDAVHSLNKISYIEKCRNILAEIPIYAAQWAKLVVSWSFGLNIVYLSKTL